MLKSNKIYFIAEIGINHNGEISMAKDLINIAKSAGCDAVKFQKRNPNICVPENMKEVLRQTPWGEMTYLDYKKRIEFGQEEYDEINSFCKKIGMTWSASAWDLDSLKFLDQYDLPFHKIASALATHSDFLHVVATKQKLTYASIGMCSWEQIENLVDIFKSHKCPLVLLHTVSNYPAKESDLNLLMIKTIQERFNLPVGYSGHESSVTPSIVAGVLGAVVIERHITLDRSLWGTDQSASLEPAGLKSLVGSLNKISTIVGDGIKREIVGETEMAAKMRYWKVSP